jgi:hypothetical protein
LIACALALVGYIGVAVTIGADFERDLMAAAEREGVGVNQVATVTQAQITHDHALYAALTAAFLFLPPVLLVVAVTGIRRVVGGRTAALAWWSGLGSAVVWWAYVGLGLGLLADPDDLPPVVRDLGTLAVPMVTTLSLLALAAVALIGESARAAGIVHRSGRAAAVTGVLIGVMSVAGLVSGGFADPVPPIVIVPSALILGIAMLRTTHQMRGDPMRLNHTLRATDDQAINEEEVGST